jgi:hypothetical protein
LGRAARLCPGGALVRGLRCTSLPRTCVALALARHAAAGCQTCVSQRCLLSIFCPSPSAYLRFLAPFLLPRPSVTAHSIPIKLGPWPQVAGHSRVLVASSAYYVTKCIAGQRRLYYYYYYYYYLIELRPALSSSGQSSWLQIRSSRVRFPALPDFLVWNIEP